MFIVELNDIQEALKDYQGETFSGPEIIDLMESLCKDTPEIIRCNGCRFWRGGDSSVAYCFREQIKAMEEGRSILSGITMAIDGDGFCSFAERK